MPASIYAWLPEEREDEERKQLLEGLYRELDECTEVKITTRNRLKIFLPERGIWHIWDIDYAVRQEYEKSLHGTIAPNCYPTYMNEFDWIKRHSVLERLQTLAGEKAEKTDPYFWFIFSHNSIRERPSRLQTRIRHLAAICSGSCQESKSLRESSPMIK